MNEKNQLQPPRLLNEWLSENMPKETMRFRNGFWDQVNFVRQEILGFLSYEPERRDSYFEEEFDPLRKEGIRVIATHGSKSIDLPVYDFTWRGIRFTMEYNFHIWFISVRSSVAMSIDFDNLVGDGDYRNSGCVNGIASKDLFPPYKQDHRNFTVCLGNNYLVFVFFWLIKQWQLRVCGGYEGAKEQNYSA